MLDKYLAELYEVETKALKQAVKRNMDIFPEHFMFELTEDEFKNLRSQIVTSSWGGQRYLPFVFTELGVLQLANVLKSVRARRMSVRILEVFVKMREMLTTQKETEKDRFPAGGLEIIGRNPDQAIFDRTLNIPCNIARSAVRDID
jgi:hypothetical protein